MSLIYVAEHSRSRNATEYFGELNEAFLLDGLLHIWQSPKDNYVSIYSLYICKQFGFIYTVLVG